MTVLAERCVERGLRILLRGGLVARRGGNGLALPGAGLAGAGFTAGLAGSRLLAAGLPVAGLTAALGAAGLATGAAGGVVLFDTSRPSSSATTGGVVRARGMAGSPAACLWAGR
jgi:hypothetical protein